MSRRIPTFVYGDDPISEAGVAAQLRGRPEVQILDGPHIEEAEVAVVVVEAIDEIGGPDGPRRATQPVPACGARRQPSRRRLVAPGRGVRCVGDAATSGGEPGSARRGDHVGGQGRRNPGPRPARTPARADGPAAARRPRAARIRPGRSVGSRGGGVAAPGRRVRHRPRSRRRWRTASARSRTSSTR